MLVFQILNTSTYCFRHYAVILQLWLLSFNAGKHGAFALPSALEAPVQFPVVTPARPVQLESTQSRSERALGLAAFRSGTQITGGSFAHMPDSKSVYTHQIPKHKPFWNNEDSHMRDSLHTTSLIHTCARTARGATHSPLGPFGQGHKPLTAAGQLVWAGPGAGVSPTRGVSSTPAGSVGFVQLFAAPSSDL